MPTVIWTTYYLALTNGMRCHLHEIFEWWCGFYIIIQHLNIQVKEWEIHSYYPKAHVR